MAYFTFSFDTEDYGNQNAAEAIIRTAKILDKYDIKGSYNVVAKMAETLIKWGREDIIEAIKKHEIVTHSLAHTHHPTINEYTDLEDFDEALAIFKEKETAAVEILRSIFGVEKIWSACPPGTSTSYVAHYGYSEMGIPCYDGDELFDQRLHRPITCCNILCLQYVVSFVEDLAPLSDEELLAYLDEAAKADYIILCNHPANFYLTRYFDGVNFRGENTPESEWKPCPTRTNEEVEGLFERFDFLARTIKNDSRFKTVTYEDIARIYGDKDRVITRESFGEIKAQILEDFFPVTTPDSFCISDLLLACRDLLCGKKEHKCGKVYGFLDTPYAITEPITLSSDEVISAAEQFGDRFLPERLVIGEKVIGPADWLRAALEVLDGAESVTVHPDVWQIDLDEFPFWRDLNYKGSWLHSKDFEDKYLSKRFRLQSWTLRLPKDTPRKIF